MRFSRFFPFVPSLILVLVSVGVCVTPLMAQVSVKTLPYHIPANVEDASVTYTVPSARLPAAEPEVLDGETGMPLVRPYQHGVETPVDLGFEKAGQWRSLPDGSRLWHLRITSKGARST